MMRLSIPDSDYLNVEFSAHKLLNPRVIWVSPLFQPNLWHNSSAKEVKKAFADRFAYIVPGGITFDHVFFDPNDSKTVRAERYGGRGIGNNGGGARCGNIDCYQIKGIGKNPLAGQGADLHHSYGGFKAHIAVHEAIYASVLNQIMPLGTATIYGVIFVGPDAAYVKGIERGWGSLMVREIVLRPAHFFRAHKFIPISNTAMRIPSDVARVRRANKELLRAAGSHAAFITYLGHFLKNCADQFSFARLSRLVHGAMTPSNLCFDGRWIDLTNTTFCNSKDNYSSENTNTPTFYEELKYPLVILSEIAETFSKYNSVKVNTAPLIRYYYECVEDGLSRHLDYLFGLPDIERDSTNQESLRLTLKVVVVSILSSGPMVAGLWPETMPMDDTILIFLGSLFISIFNRKVAVRKLTENLKFEYHIATRIIEAFSDLLKTDYSTVASNYKSYNIFIVSCAIASIKRCLLAEYFYKGRIETFVKSLLAADDLDGAAEFMNVSVMISEWAFGGVEISYITLLKTPKLLILFDVTCGEFRTVDENSPSCEMSLLSDVTNYISTNPVEYFVAGGYDFRPYLEYIFDLFNEAALNINREDGSIFT
jgi:hypothetical protein